MNSTARGYAICLVVALALSLSILTCTPTTSKAGMISLFSSTTVGATHAGGSVVVNYEGSAMRMAQRQKPEEAWQKLVLEYAERGGWLRWYIPDVMWRRAFVNQTPMQFGDRGFPDLLLVRGNQVLFRELKAKGGTLSDHQIIWRDALREAGADWDIWFPADRFTKVEPILMGDRIREGL